MKSVLSQKMTVARMTIFDNVAISTVGARIFKERFCPILRCHWLPIALATSPLPIPMASIVFTLEDGSTIITPLDVDLITIGRAEDSIVQLPCPSVSSHHATVKARPDGYYVQDLGSRNATRLNGAEIEEALLNDGDRIAFGDIQAVFYASDEVPTAIPVAEPEPIAIPTPEIKRIVDTAPPVTGIPHGATTYNPRPRVHPSRSVPMNEGGGCVTGIILTLLFGGAFLIGLSLRHYKVTDGGVLPNDFISKLFSKVKIEVKDDSAK